MRIYDEMILDKGCEKKCIKNHAKNLCGFCFVCVCYNDSVIFYVKNMTVDSKVLTNILIVGIFVMMAYLVFSDRDVRVDMTTSEGERTISVDGTAETFVAPDTASVSFAIMQKSPTTSVATDSVNKRMDVLVKDLEKIGIEKKDIKTVQYDVQPEYSYNEGKQKFEGYRVTQRVDVVMRDLDTTSDVLATVNSAGVDNVSELKFFVDDTEGVMKDLQKQAINDAKEKAKELSKDLGVNLNEIVGYDTVNDNSVQPAYRSDMAFAAVKEENAPAVVPTGENQFVSNVSVVYKIN